MMFIINSQELTHSDVVSSNAYSCFKMSHSQVKQKLGQTVGEKKQLSHRDKLSWHWVYIAACDMLQWFTQLRSCRVWHSLFADAKQKKCMWMYRGRSLGMLWLISQTCTPSAEAVQPFLLTSLQTSIYSFQFSWNLSEQWQINWTVFDRSLHTAWPVSQR